MQVNSSNSREKFTDYLYEIPNYFSVFAVAVYFYTAGPMLIEISKNLNINLGNLNLIFTFFTVGSVAGQLSSVIYNRRFRNVVIVLASNFLIILSLVFLILATNLALFYLLNLLLGYGAGIILIQATKDVLESRISNKERLTTILLFFYPIGSFTAPFIASTLIKNNLSWRYSYYVMLAISLTSILLYIFLKLRRKDNLVLDIDQKIALKNIFHNKKLNFVFSLMLVLLFFYCMSETIVATWSPTFLRMERSFDIGLASLAVSIFWMGALAGRILISIIAGKIKTDLIIFSLALFSVISLLFFVTLRPVTLILVFSAVSGLGFSGIPSLGIALAGTVYEKGRGVLVSIIFAVNYAGISLAPFMAKIVSSRNMELSISLAPAFMSLVLLSAILKLLYQKKSNAQAMNKKDGGLS